MWHSNSGRRLWSLHVASVELKPPPMCRRCEAAPETRPGSPRLHLLFCTEDHELAGTVARRRTEESLSAVSRVSPWLAAANVLLERREREKAFTTAGAAPAARYSE